MDNEKYDDSGWRAIEILLMNGNDITLPLSVISEKVENLEERVINQYELIKKIDIDNEKLKEGVAKINQESVKARNQMIYMFLTIIGTLLSKLFYQHIVGN